MLTLAWAADYMLNLATSTEGPAGEKEIGLAQEFLAKTLRGIELIGGVRRAEPGFEDSGSLPRFSDRVAELRAVQKEQQGKNA